MQQRKNKGAKGKTEEKLREKLLEKSRGKKRGVEKVLVVCCFNGFQ